jgi:N-carbamoyl-L-amino-acid hydrolase
LVTSRAIDDLRELASLTSNEEGAQRVAWTPTWAAARAWMREQLDELPVEVVTDEAGNVWATLSGESERAVLIGGHIDSVPNGGWLDGALNVVAGLQVLRRVATEGRPKATVRLVDWADEEGARFGRTCFGSSAASRSLKPDDVRGLYDRDGVPFPHALGEYGVVLDDVNASARELRTAAAYLELHIEQAPVLERMALPLAVVTGTAGVERHLVRFAGRTSHAGSTPMQDRRDSLVAASRFIEAVDHAARRECGVGTVGTVRLEPGIVTAVPGVCEVGLDMRHQDASALLRMIEEVRHAAAASASREDVTVGWSELWRTEPLSFDPDLIALAEETVLELAGDCPRLFSGALHDAAEAAKAGVPTVMLFVQSVDGISHSNEEDTKPEHIELAVEALDRLVTKVIERVA